jgi:hypothetical protein
MSDAVKQNVEVAAIDLDVVVSPNGCGGGGGSGRGAVKERIEIPAD